MRECYIYVIGSAAKMNIIGDHANEQEEIIDGFLCEKVDKTTYSIGITNDLRECSKYKNKEYAKKALITFKNLIDGMSGNADREIFKDNHLSCKWNIYRIEICKIED